MRVDPAPDAVVEPRQIGPGALPGSVHGGNVIHQLAAAEHGHQQVLVLGAGRDVFPAGHVHGVYDGTSVGDTQVLVVDGVRHVPGALAKTTRLEDTRRRHLDGLLRELHLVDPLVAVAHGTDARQLVDAPEGGLVIGGGEPRANAPDVDARTLLLERRDQVFVQIVAADDDRIGETPLVQDAARLYAEERQIARVQPDADHLVAALPQPAPHFHRMADPVQAVEGVHQQEAVVGHGVGVGVERFHLVVEGQHPTVRVGALDRNVEELAGQGVGGSGAPAHVRRPARRQGAVETLGAPEPELQHRLPAGRLAHPRRLGGDERLEADDVEQHRFQDLALQDGAAYPHQRLVREHHRSLGHRVHVAGKAGLPEIVEKGVLEHALAVVAAQPRQVFEVAGVEAETGEHPHDVPEPATHGETSLVRVLAEREMKHRFLRVGAGLPVGVRHRELVEVREERERVGVELFERVHG